MGLILLQLGQMDTPITPNPIIPTPPPSPAPSRRPLFLLVIAVVILALILIAWRQGWFSRSAGTSDLTEEEIAAIENFLAQTDFATSSPEEAAAINDYLQTATDTLSESEKAQILDYLQ